MAQKKGDLMVTKRMALSTKNDHEEVHGKSMECSETREWTLQSELSLTKSVYQ